MRISLSILVASLAAVLAGCGGGGGGGTGGAGGTASTSSQTTTSTTTVTTTITRTSSGIGGAGSVEVFFLAGERLRAVDRSVPKQAPARGAMLELLEGPQGTSLSTAIPAATTLNSVHIEDGVATVDLSKAFESGGGSLSMQERVAQVVYTLTQFSSAHLVRFQIEGKLVTALGGEGLVLNPPVGREQFSEFAP